MARAPKGTREEWAARVTQLEESGLTLAAFASEKGLRPSTLSWWRSKIIRDSVPSRPARSSQRSSREGEAKAPLQFIEVTASSQTAAIEILLRSGNTVRVRAGFDPATLARVLDVLEARRG